jgi:hypothetical protein
LFLGLVTLGGIWINPKALSSKRFFAGVMSPPNMCITNLGSYARVLDQVANTRLKAKKNWEDPQGPSQPSNSFDQPKEKLFEKNYLLVESRLKIKPYCKDYIYS